MLLSPQQLASHPDLLDLSIRIGGDIVHTCDSARNLGVIFDSRMDMHSHISRLAQLSFIQLRNIRAIKNVLSLPALEKIIHAFISSRIDYGNSLLYGLPEYAIKRVQRIQNAAARLLSGTGKYDPITPVLKSLHWLPVRQRINFKVLLLTYKSLNDLAPSYLKDTLEVRNHGRSMRTQNSLYLPRTSTKTYGDRAFSIAAPKLWNGLPADIRSKPSINAFKKSLKTHLFKTAFQ